MARIAKLVWSQPLPSDLTPPTEPPHDSGMETRVAKLEGGFDTFRWAAGIMVAAIVGITLATIGLVWNTRTETFQRMDRLEVKVDALPGAINRNLLEISRTLSDAITAAKPGQPPVIVISPAEMVRQPAQPPVPFKGFVAPPQ